VTHLLTLALGVTIGVVVALRLVYGRPAPVYEEPLDPESDEYAAWLAEWERVSA
jgi:hypothetical protein